MKDWSEAGSQARSGIQRKVFDAGLLVLLASILCVAGLLSVIAGMKLALSRSEVEIPAVAGLTPGEAQKLVEQLGLKLQVGGERYDRTVAAGVITSQQPPAGMTSKPGRSLQVILSMGRQTHPVPDLVGSTAGVAKMTSKQSNYVIGRISTMTVPGVAKDIVLAQSPPAGSMLAQTPRIDVLVSTGEEASYVMPDFVGQNLNRVKSFLEKNKVELSGVQYRFHQTSQKGTVIGQFPRAGHVLHGNQGITLEVAR